MGSAALAIRDPIVVWQPQPGPQKALIDCPLPEVFYGGARGGGKTDGVVGKYAIKGERYGKHFNAIFFRKELPMCDDAIERSHEILGPLGWKYNAGKYAWRSPAGGRLRFRPLESISDAEKYQGQNITDATVEEAGNYPDPRPIDRLNGVLRSVHGVPTQLILTGNPGGPGQNWIRERYVSPHPTGMRVLKRTLPNGKEHRFVYIPSRLQNNRMLMVNDPDYINRLHLVGNEKLVQAWLDGDWSAIEGAYFDCWTDAIVIRPVVLPEHWFRFASFDWGSARPFSVGWWAVASEPFIVAEGVIPKGAMVRYREWYGVARNPDGTTEANTGLKLTAEQIGEGIAERSMNDPKIAWGVADPSAFAEEGGPSYMERILKAAKKVYADANRTDKPFVWRHADNKRVADKGHLGGWDQLRERMRGEDGRPMIYCFSTCADSIRTIPVLQHDKNRAEDLDTDGEDHCFVAGTLVDTDHGAVKIEDLVPGKHAVWSAGQWRKNFCPRLTRIGASVVRLRFDNGAVVVCTGDHEFMDFSGEWRYAKDLQNVEASCDLSLSATQSRHSTARGFIAAAVTSKNAVGGSIGLSGNGITEQSRMGRTSTIRMVTAPTTTRPTWSVYPLLTTWAASMAKRAATGGVTASTRPAMLLPDGTAAMMVEGGIASTSTSTFGPSWMRACLQFARNAAANIWSPQPRSSRENTVAVPVRPVRCVSVENAGTADVYCIDEPETRAFTIEGGLIVHNCADEWRYAAMARPYTRPRPAAASGPRDRWNKAFGEGRKASWKTV